MFTKIEVDDGLRAPSVNGIGNFPASTTRGVMPAVRADMLGCSSGWSLGLPSELCPHLLLFLVLALPFPPPASQLSGGGLLKLWLKPLAFYGPSLLLLPIRELCGGTGVFRVPPFFGPLAGQEPLSRDPSL